MQPPRHLVAWQLWSGCLFSDGDRWGRCSLRRHLDNLLFLHVLWVVLQTLYELCHRVALIADLIDCIEQWEPGGRGEEEEEGFRARKVQHDSWGFPASANGGSAARWAWCATYLSTRFLCSRMRCTSAAVAGPCSFWPFSISFSSCSMDWVKEAKKKKKKE